MTPNLFVATQTLFQPHRWFKDRKSERSTRKTEHWNSPVPGNYEYIPGRGWYLIAKDSDAPSSPFVDTDTDTDTTATEGGPVGAPSRTNPKDMVRIAQPIAVRYSKVLKRYLLAPDYLTRKRYGQIEDARGKTIEVGFFQLDDKIAWVQCWDREGEFIPGPYKLWCIDASSSKFRHMLRKDDPAYLPSRQNSFERESNSRRRSQDSRSTQYRSSGPGTLREDPSAPSTRPNSIKGLISSTPTSKPGSQANSRRNSLKRNASIPLEEAKAALRAMAKAQADAVKAGVGASEERRGRQGRRDLQSMRTPTTIT
ncbi:hypothetical protein K504DRAFT_460162 [Pleomassaria siparia CBS 279.74]|uniref:Uncharacterized protein n=1 Tax=Pleomassaria siparia CBS 279.74 TaxID=1314801 RepID=A0A6G1JZU7_9PLEO|nr:hypothetical protein K504DRAFT_460162 [Pleomassaria siparia CBS 279.74]